MRFLAVFLLAAMTGAAFADNVQSGASTSVPVKKEDPGVAKQRELDGLLAKLHSANASGDISKIEDQIWQDWSRNASPTAEVLLRQASAAINAGDYEPAEQMLTQAIETYPQYAEAWNRRAALYYAIGRYDAALLDVNHALDLEPRNYGALIGKGMILRAQKHDDDAVAAFNDALAINPHLDAVKALLKQIDKERPNI